MKTYTVKNLSCANCAMKIEEALCEMDSVREARLNFGSARLSLDTDDLGRVLAEMRRIEPDIDIMESGTETDEQDHRNRRQLTLLIGSLVVFGLGMLIETFTGWSPLLPVALFLLSYGISGWKVVYTALRNILRGQVFDEHFLMTVATGGAMAIGELSEAALVMIFYQLGSYLEDLSVGRSRRSIRSLVSLKADSANVLEGDQIRSVPIEEVPVGSTVVVRPGERIPLDGEVISGAALLDTSALTGESVPQEKEPGDTVLAGMIDQNGLLQIRTTRTSDQSAVARIMHLVEEATGRKARTERFLTRFARIYTPAVVFSALAVAVLPPLFIAGQTFNTWIYRALVMLVVSCPCALVVSVPLAYFGGVGRAARRGILVRGSQYLDALARVRTVVLDKTGTLTQGVFQVSEVRPADGHSEQELIELASTVESQSTHPVAVSIMAAAGNPRTAEIAFDSYQEIRGQGVVAVMNGTRLAAGNDTLLHRLGVDHPETECRSPGTVVHLSRGDEYVGNLVVSDRLKEGAREAVDGLRGMGIDEIVMLTGDSKAAAELVSDSLGLDGFYAELLPEDKLARLEELAASRAVAFVGDGINDAPVLARADVGMAVGDGGSDAAIETADIVLMSADPRHITEAVDVARRTRQLVWQNIAFAFVIKLVFIGLGALGALSMWGAVFGDMGVALLAILNALRILR